MNWKRRTHYGTYNPIKKDPELAARIETVLALAALPAHNRSFLADLCNTCVKTGGLTERQLAAFVKIESRFSEAEVEKFEEWKKEYLADHQEDAKIIANYYMTSAGYFKKTASAIVEDESYIPTKNDWKRMTQNKYAQKVLELTNLPARFNVNDTVQFRSTAGNAPGRDNRGEMMALRHRLAFVIQNDLPIVSSVNGGKRYCVLPMGYTHPVILEERDIMKPNKRGKTS
jgi:hypothetical protein